MEIDGQQGIEQGVGVDQMLDDVGTDDQVKVLVWGATQIGELPVAIGIARSQPCEIAFQFETGGLELSQLMNQLVARSASQIEDAAVPLLTHRVLAVEIDLLLPFIGEIHVVVVVIVAAGPIGPADLVALLHRPFLFANFRTSVELAKQR